MTVRARRTLSAGILATLALVVAGCGGGKTGASSQSGASIVRSGALAFVSIDSDLGSSQWQAADKLFRKFPIREQALAAIRRELSKQGVEWDRDVKPALGPEVDVAVVAGATLKETSFAVLTKPDDAGKFKELVAKLNQNDPGNKAVYREVDGWYALSQSQQMIDRTLKSGGGSLAGDGVFKDALDALPSDALVKAYVNGDQLAALIKQAAQQSGTPFDVSTVGLDKLDFVSASLSAEGDGFRLKGAARGEGASALGGGDYASKLLGGVPGDALAFLTVRGGSSIDQFEKLKTNPAFGAVLSQAQEYLGVSLDEVLALLRNEIALYVRSGVIPEVSLVLETPDESSALATLDKLAARVAGLVGGKVTSGQEGGKPVKTIDFGQFAIHYAGLGGKVMITSGATGLSNYGGSGQKLPDDADFKDAQAAAGMPDSTGGFLYVDLKDAIPLVEGLAGLAGDTAPRTENLRPLRSLLAWAAGSGDTRSFDAFLEIK